MSDLISRSKEEWKAIVDAHRIEGYLVQEFQVPYQTKNIDFAKVLSARRRNARVLEQALADLTAAGKLRPLCKSESTAGLYYPILLENRDAVQQALARRNIYCPVIWPIPAQAEGICETCEATAAHILALPCDQRYTEQDMATIAETLKAIITGEE